MERQEIKMGLIWWLLVVVAAAAALVKSVASDETYEVGDSFGWAIPPNTSFYHDWATSKNFNLRDSVGFKWSGNHNAIEVTKADYDNCTNSATLYLSVTNATGVVLTTTGSRYFICTIDNHCQLGQKVTITVDGPPPPPTSNSASSLVTVGAALSALLVSAGVMSFFTCI